MRTPPKLLMIEDNELNTEMLRRRLEKRGYLVECRSDGQDLHAVVQSAQPDLILMDLNLPGIDGWTLSRALKLDPGSQGIPIIAVTAHAMPGDREKAIEAGCDDYVTKPIDFALLVSKIDRLLPGFDRRQP